MNRNSIPLHIKQKLFLISGNKCALPDCYNELFDIDKEIYVGEIAHIESYNAGGARRKIF